jgi:hypothetical protein
MLRGNPRLAAAQLGPPSPRLEFVDHRRHGLKRSSSAERISLLIREWCAKANPSVD